MIEPGRSGFGGNTGNHGLGELDSPLSALAFSLQPFLP
jgi:hypothetical protein